MLGGAGGRMLGGILGQGDAGASAGTGIGAAISRWLGSGDYSVSSNSLVQKVSAGADIPSMHKEGQSIIVRHKEFLTEITGTTAFTVQQSFSINPGLSTTFPWLSGIASQYSEYRIKGMVYHYIPTSGTVSSGTNPALGSVMLQTSYRASELAPTSKVEMMNEYWASEARPCDTFCHPIECDPKENPFNVQYIRTSAVPSGDTVLMYDLGKTTLATSGQQANGVVLGDLWVTYEIELRKPVLTDLNNSSLNSFAGTATASIDNTHAFGSNFTVSNTSFPVTIAIGANTVNFPQGSTGTYFIIASYPGATASAFATTTVSGTGSSLVSNMGSGNGRSTTYTVGTGTAFNCCVVTITQPSTATVVTFGTTTIVGPTSMFLYITEANPTIF